MSLREERLGGGRIADRDGVHRAVRGRVDQVVALGAVRVDHDRLLVVVELEDVWLRFDAVAEAVAELAIDLDHEPFSRRGRAAHAATGSSAGSCSASHLFRSSRWRRETTSRCTWAVPSKIW